MPYRPYNAQAVEKREKFKREEAERRGKVVRFLRENPLSTSEEIFKATGCAAGCAEGLIKAPQYNGRRVYRLNHQKVSEFGLA